MTAQVQAINITPGEHIEWHVFGLTLNGDTITSTLIAGAILVVLGLLVARKASAREPTKLQLAWETVVAQVEKQVEDTMGIKTAPFVVPLALTLFLFILISNLLALIPTGHHPEYAPPPASDVNLTYALAVLVIGTMHVVGVRKRGLRGYYGHLFRKPYALIPLNIVEEVMKPVTLSLRLFGNIFAGTIMVALIAAMPAFILWLPDVLWKLFDAFIGLIQAFIFALLTILYFSSVAPAKEGANH
ncbi:MAG: F-type H+-transporting ATPase subunit a [Pseudonocardiales bacterium]|nr:F-type H+-transporting ATPase subunit a [Pseudonocardiales bacterium]